MKTKFGKFMIIYAAVAVVAIGFLWFKLWGIVDTYQQELPEYAMDDYMETFNNEYYNKLVAENSDINVSEFEDADKIVAKYGKASIEGKELSYKKKTGKYTNTSPVYSVLADDKEVAEVSFKENKYGKGRKKWAVNEEIAEGIKINGKEKVTVSAPEGCSVFVNGVEVDKKYITGTTEEAKLLENVKKYISDIPEMEIYTVEGLCEKPEVQAKSSDGKELEATVDGNNYSYGFQSDDDFAAANDQWIISMINAYALYLSNDGSFTALTPYLYPDDTTEGLKSKLSTIGVSWYTDHTSTSLSDQKVSDYKQYGDNCFSCIVTFKQTVNGIGGSGDKSVVNDNKLICIFVKSGNEWKWAGMNTLEIDK